MEFRLDEGQVELQQTVARFCTDSFPLDAVADREGSQLDRAAWTGLADLGVLGLLLPEDDGGVGLGTVDAAIVFEQLGSHLAPGPVLWSLLAAPYVDGVATGEVVVGGVATIGDGALLVEHADEIDVLLVVGDHDVTLHRSLPAPAMLDALDPLSRIGRFGDLGPGEEVGGADHAERSRTLGRVLASALLAGISHRSLEVARTYALERRQFDVPIGSFQAVKHMLADMYVRTTAAQSATYAAAAVLDDPGSDDPARAAASAKLQAADAALENVSTAIQVLGGMGFTWDMLPNHLLKRAWVLESDFGTRDDQALALAATLPAVST